MAASWLERWLKTDDSRKVGRTCEGDDEPVGHQPGRRIVEIKHKRQAGLTDEDYAHIAQSHGYIRRHMAQGGPASDIFAQAQADVIIGITPVAVD